MSRPDELQQIGQADRVSGRVLSGHAASLTMEGAGWFGFLLEPVAGPAEFDPLVTFSDVRDLDPGHPA
jgi:hypothetical protein